MAIIKRASSGVANSSRMSYSTFFQIPNPAAAGIPTSLSAAPSSGGPGAIELLNFGVSNPITDPVNQGPFLPKPVGYYDHSSIGILPPTAGRTSYRVQARIVGSTLSNFAGGIATHNYLSGAYDPTIATAGVPSSHTFVLHRANITGGPTFTDTWHHLLVSVNLAGTDSWTGASTSTTLSRGRFVETYFDTIRMTGDYLLVEKDDIFPTAPASNIATSGLEFSIPVLSGFVTDAIDSSFNWPLPTSLVRFAYTMIWFGQYIDPTADNLSRFVYIGDDGLPWPADITGQLAISAFGPPSFHFHGGMDTFATNLGTAGVMTTTGTLTDFVPPPGSPSALGPGV